MSQAVGFPYYYTGLLGLNAAEVIIGHSFSGNPSGVFAPRDAWATSSYHSEIIGASTGVFGATMGSGAFNGTAYLKSSGLIEEIDFSCLLSFRQAASGNAVLFSTATGGEFSSYSGITFGINDANRLFFKYWNDVEGPMGFTYPFILGEGNIVTLCLNDTTVKVGHYNQSTYSFDILTSEVRQNNLIWANQFYIGGSPGGAAWSNFNKFSGHIDDFYFVSGFLDDSYLNALGSGFYSEMRSGGLEIVSILTPYSSGVQSGILIGTGVTGYQQVPLLFTDEVITGISTESGMLNVGSGVTGFASYVQEIITNECGQSYDVVAISGVSGINYVPYANLNYLTGNVTLTGYQYMPLSGYISGTTTVNVTGYISGNATGLVADYLFIDSGFINSLKYNKITPFFYIDGGDFLENYHMTGVQTGRFLNKTPDFNNAEGEFQLKFEDSGLYSNLVFVNGQFLPESGYVQYQSGYYYYYTPSGACFFDENSPYVIRTNGLFSVGNNPNLNDYAIYDHSTVRGGGATLYVNSIVLTGNYQSGNTIPGANFSSGHFVFYNGQKLISGVDYSGVNVSMRDFDSGSILSVTNPSGAYDRRAYGSGFFGQNSGFFRGTSQVYFNGARQLINRNYIENTHFDKFYSLPANPEIFLDYIYDNNDLFWD